MPTMRRTPSSKVRVSTLIMRRLGHVGRGRQEARRELSDGRTKERDYRSEYAAREKAVMWKRSDKLSLALLQVRLDVISLALDPEAHSMRS